MSKKESGTKRQGRSPLFRQAVVSITLNGTAYHIGRMSSVRFSGGVTRSEQEITRHILKLVMRQVHAMVTATETVETVETLDDEG